MVSLNKQLPGNTVAATIRRNFSHETKFVKDEWRKFACDHE